VLSPAETRLEQLEHENSELRARLALLEAGDEGSIEQAQKLESLGVLAGGIAHDFNNLLVAVLGNASLALQQLDPQSELAPLLKHIETAASRAAELTSHLLAYSGRGRLEAGPLDLSELVRELSSLLDLSIHTRATVNLDLTERLPAIIGDASQLRQVVMNLIMNASDSLGDSSGSISVCTYKGSGADAGMLCFEVADTGEGMEPARRERIFEPFFSTKASGRGLGLAVVEGIVRGHNGRIDVSSELGRGTRFRVWLPSSGLPVPVPELEPEPKRQSISGRILVIDDEKAVRETLIAVLSEFGHRVFAAEDGAEALELWKKHKDEIELVLTDLTMPRMGAEDVLELLRKAGCKAPVVLMSGFDSQDLATRYAEKGFAGFLQKPFRIQEVLAKLEQVSRSTGAD